MWVLGIELGSSGRATSVFNLSHLSNSKGFFFVSLFFEIGSHYVALVVLELTL